MDDDARCPDRSVLERLVSGLTSEDEAWPLERHLAECARCGQLADSLVPEDDLVAAMRARSPIVADTQVVDGLLVRCRDLRDEAAATLRSGDETPTNGWADDAALLDPAQQPGEIGRIGSYSVVKVLGAGGMGVVYQAWQVRPRRLVALKLSRSRVPNARRAAEPDIVARLQHPNVVPIHAVGDHAGQTYFTMEFMEGGSLAAKLAAAPLSARAAAELVQVLAQAVHFAHGQGVIHRDLKPSNVLLTREGIPKIADFGLAKQLASNPGGESSDQTHSGAILGTPGYLAPEQAAGKAAQVGPAADVYSLGAILYECLTGRPPFKAASVLETLEQVRSQEPIPPTRLQRGVPRDLQTICLKCLAKEPGKRYLTADELAADLERFLRGEPIVARPLSRVERAWRWMRRRPAAAALLLVSGLAMAALIGGVLLHNRSLQASEAQAQAERERADAGYQEARAALNRMLARLERQRIGDVPQIKELQRDLLEDALAFYLGVLAQSTDAKPSVRRDTAEACLRAATIQTMLGRQEQGSENLTRALNLVASLPEEERDGEAAQLIVSSANSNLGMIALAAKRWDEAERCFHTSLDVNNRMASAQSTFANWRNAAAESEHNLGVVCQLTQRMKEAEAWYDHAVASRTRLVQENPGDERVQVALVDEFINLALLRQNTGRVAESAQTYERLEQLLQPLLAKKSSRPEHGLAVTAAYTNWSYLLSHEGKNDEALTKLGLAIDLAEDILRAEPNHAAARGRCLNAHGTRAQLHAALGRHGEAVMDWDRVVALAEEKDRPIYRLHRAGALGRAGQHARAAAEVQSMVNGPRFSDDWFYFLTHPLGLSIAAVHKDNSLVSVEQNALAEGYTKQAMAILRQLQKEGYFKMPRHAAKLTTDAELESLRGHAAFQGSLAEITGDVPKGKP